MESLIEQGQQPFRAVSMKTMNKIILFTLASRLGPTVIKLHALNHPNLPWSQSEDITLLSRVRVCV